MTFIGREQEQKQMSAILRAGRHVLLEGPVGSGKTTLALAVAGTSGKSVLRVDGDGRFTEQKLVGSFDPKLVLEQGFVAESFIPGPLYTAMKTGSILFLNELNRMPEMVQNVLLPALDEGKIQIPILGELIAKPGFCIIATQNPREFIATSPLSEALLDRLEWISIPYASESDEQAMVRSQLTKKNQSLNTFTDLAVELVRATRSHPKIRRGASIRAAISLMQLLENEEKPTVETFWDFAQVVLANRIELQVGKYSAQSYSELLSEILAELRSSLKKKS